MNNKSHALKRASVTLLATCYFIHLFHVIRTAVNVPHRDEWQILTEGLRSSFIPLEWLLLPHNEHFIVSTKLVVWSLYLTTAWDARIHLVLNFLLYGALTFAVVKLCLRILPSKMSWLAYLSAIFPLSTLNWENHLWAFQTSIHTSLLSTVLAVTLLSKIENRISLWSGVALTLLAPLSFSSGYAASLLIGLYLLFRSFQTSQTYSRIELRIAAVTVFTLLAFLVFYLSEHRLTASLTLPTDGRFWLFFTNVISLGFGIEIFSLPLAILASSLCLFAILLGLRDSCAGKTCWAVSLLLLAVCLSLASIALGRADEKDIEIWSKGSRYYEISVLLVPLVASVFATSLKGSFRTLMVVATLVFATLGHINNTSFAHYYWTAGQKEEGRACARSVLLESESKDCSSIWGMGTKEELLRTKALNLSYLRR